MKTLVVSCAWPGPLAESSHGLFRRFDMMAGALRRVSSSVNALFFVAPELQERLGSDGAASAQLSARWDMPVQVQLCARASLPSPAGPWQSYVLPALNFLRQEPYAETAGQAQKVALAQALADRPDLLFVHRLRAMPPVLGHQGQLPPTLFDLDDIEHVSYARSLTQGPQWRGKRLLQWRLPALRRGEVAAIRRATRTLVCSTEDRESLLKQLPVAPNSVLAVPNAVLLPEPVALTTAPVLMSIGQYAYEPNRAGIEFFLDQVWPLIHCVRPDATLIVAGPNPQLVRHSAPNLLPKGVTFTGFVPDLSTLYVGTRVVVCPIQSGSGTRVKLVEAAAWARPIVSTHIGAEGLGMVDGQHALLRDSPSEMAAACLQLLSDDAKAQALREAARSLTAACFDRQIIEQRLADLMSNLAANQLTS